MIWLVILLLWVPTHAQNNKNCTITEVVAGNSQSETLVLATNQAIAELWVKFGNTFDYFRISIKVREKSSSTNMNVTKNLMISKTSMFSNEFDSSKWYSVIVQATSIGRKKLWKATILIRGTVNKKSYDIDTKLSWDDFEIEGVYVHAKGDLDFSIGLECKPPPVAIDSFSPPSKAKSIFNSHSFIKKQHMFQDLRLILHWPQKDFTQTRHLH